MVANTSHTKSEDTVFPKGSYVIINGLKSEAGKKLNGGKGILINKSTITDGVPRYPVLFYATKDTDNAELAVLNDTFNKKIKAENVFLDPKEPTENKLLHDVALFHVRKTQELEGGAITEDNEKAFKDTLFWAEQLYKSTPDDFGAATTYANLLRYHNKFGEAFTIIKRFNNIEDHVKPTNPLYPQYCFDFAMARVMVRQEMELALEYALKIPRDNTDLLDRLSEDALMDIMEACNELIHEGTNSEIPNLAAVNVRAAQTFMEWHPDNAKAMANLAAAYCLEGNNLEGSRCYRRALTMPGLTGEPLETSKTSLIVAQLQCPGMPLEDYDILSSLPTNQVACKKKGGGATQLYSLPTDPDDPNFFPKTFLDDLRI